MDVSQRIFKEVAWVRLIGLPVHLWSRPILRRTGDRCGGFLAMDKDMAFMSDLQWARIWVKWNGKTLPQFVEVLEGQSRYEIYLWWEILPFVRSASALRELEPRNGVREEEEGARTGESVSSAGSHWEKTDGTEEVPLGREKQSDCLAHKQSDVEVSRSDLFCGVGQVLGLIQREGGLGQLPGLHSPTQTSRPKVNMPGIGSGEPIKRAFGAFTGPVQIPFLDHHIRSHKVKIPA